MKRLLVVDDERGSRESLRSIFEKLYQVTLADGAAAAQRLLSEERFDLMLLDVMMQQKDGVTLLKEAHEAYPDLPVIMVSASTSGRPVVECMNLLQCPATQDLPGISCGIWIPIMIKHFVI